MILRDANTNLVVGRKKKLEPIKYETYVNNMQSLMPVSFNNAECKINSINTSTFCKRYEFIIFLPQAAFFAWRRKEKLLKYANSKLSVRFKSL